MNNNLRKYAFDLSEDYLIFMEQYREGNHEWISPAAYARARIKNIQDELLRYTVEQIQEMGVLRYTIEQINKEKV